MTLDRLTRDASDCLTEEEREVIDAVGGDAFRWGIALTNDADETWVYVEDDYDNWYGFVDLSTLKNAASKDAHKARLGEEWDEGVYATWWEYLGAVVLEDILEEDFIEGDTHEALFDWLCGFEEEPPEGVSEEELVERILDGIESHEDDEAEED